MNISLAAEPLFHIGTFPVTNTLLVTWAVILFMLAIAFLASRSLREVPGRLQNAVEAVIDGLVDFIQSVAGDRKMAVQFLPIVGTIFLFVLFSNWVEVLPGLGSVGLWEVHEGKQVIIPFLRSASADLNTTLAIAIVAVMSLQVFGIVTIGFFKYMKRFFNFTNPINGFVGILELISEFARIISFSFRLFGNIFAGEVLLLVVSSLVAWLVPLPFLFLELFVGLIQAVVFATLTLVFLTMAVAEQEEGH